MNNNKIGVWMDYSHAIFIDPYSLDTVFEVLTAVRSAGERFKGETSNTTSFQPGQRSNNEFREHQKEIKEQKQYFKTVTGRLHKYDEIFLFGPSNAARALYNDLQEIQEFRNKKISWEKADKMTDNQLLTRVKKHFFETVS